MRLSKSILKIYSVTTTVLVVAVVLLAFLLAGVRLLGLKPYTVLSGSMEPKYHVGSVIYIKKVDPAELKIGDPLTYTVGNNTVVTHEIVEIQNPDDPAKRTFITQGLTNNVADAPVSADRIIGKPLFSIPYLGYLSNFVQNPPGTYVAIAAVLAILLLSFVPDLLKEKAPVPEQESISQEAAADGDASENKTSNL